MKAYRVIGDEKHLYIKVDGKESRKAILFSLIDILTLKGCVLRDKILEIDFELYTFEYEDTRFAISLSQDDNELILLCVDREKDLTVLENLLS